MYAILISNLQVASGSTKGRISVAELEKGLYISQIKGEKSQKTLKFLVK